MKFEFQNFAEFYSKMIRHQVLVESDDGDDDGDDDVKLPKPELMLKQHTFLTVMFGILFAVCIFGGIGCFMSPEVEAKRTLAIVFGTIFFIGAATIAIIILVMLLRLFRYQKEEIIRRNQYASFAQVAIDAHKNEAWYMKFSNQMICKIYLAQDSFRSLKSVFQTFAISPRPNMTFEEFNTFVSKIDIHERPTRILRFPIKFFTQYYHQLPKESKYDFAHELSSFIAEVLLNNCLLYLPAGTLSENQRKSLLVTFYNTHWYKITSLIEINA
jgi:hypothetical protein